MISISRKSVGQLLVILLTLVMAIGLNSCKLNQLKTVAAQKPELVFASLSAPATFNYPLNQSAYSVFGFIYEGLLNENGLTGELEPALAESWQISPDTKRITFTLRSDLKWSDGEPLTADDIIFTYNEIYFNEKIATGIRDILRIGTKGLLPTVKKIDDRRVEFSTPEPFVPFLRYMGGITILPAHALRDLVRKTDDKGKPLFLSAWGTGTNPKEIISNAYYRMVSYIPSQRVIFERNPYYWRKDAEGNQLPYIERVVLQIIENTDTQLLAFRTGELDNLEVAPEAFQLLKREENRGKFKIYEGGVDTGVTFIAFNLNKARNEKGIPLVEPIKSKWFNNVAFRQAIAYALDRETMKTNVFRGLGELQNSPIYVKSPYYLSPEEGLKVYNYDLEKAKQLLLKAGFKYNPEGELLDGDGNRVVFTLLCNAERKARIDMATQIQRDLAKIGIKVDLQVMSFNSYVSKLRNTKDWDCYIGGFGGSGVEPHGSFNIWSTGGTLHTFNQGPLPEEPPLNGWEITDWEKEIDRLFIAASQEFDEKKRKAIYGKFQQIAQEQLPFIHLINKLSLEGVRDRVQNVKYSALGGAFWNIYEMKVAE